MNCVQQSDHNLTLNQSAHMLAWYCTGMKYRTALRSTGFTRKQGKLLRVKLLANSRLPEIKLDILKFANTNENLRKFNVAFSHYSEDDRALLKRFFAMNAYLRVWAYAHCMEEVPTFGQLQNECQRFFAEGRILQTAETFSKRKLAFLHKSNNLSSTDYAHELVLRAVQTYYYYRPIASVDYALNCARQSMHHIGINIIHAETDESKSRLLAVNGGFENRVREWRESDDMPTRMVDPVVFSSELDKKVYLVLSGQDATIESWLGSVKSRIDAVKALAQRFAVPLDTMEKSLNTVKDYVLE